MKIIDLQFYRSRKAIMELEKKIGQLALTQKIGTANEMKICLREYLKIRKG